ncbi:MAG TPA: hypothetical protein PK597_00390 [Oscillospiraceae bacterium]|nr:hypothetical protein [Oscillospiraceae bacterium]
MSKEAAAAGGTVGTLPYFKALNEDLLLAPFMRDVSGWRYYEALEALAGRCRETIDVLCDDLKAHARIIRYVPARNRMNALNLVETLSGGAALVSPFCGNADECAAILSLSASETGTKSRAGDADVDRAEALLSSGFGPLSGFQRESLVQETLRWGVSSAAGADETKQNFLAELCGAGGLGFLEDVWNKHLYQTSPDSFSGAGGYAVCSEDHIDYL